LRRLCATTSGADALAGRAAVAVDEVELVAGTHRIDAQPGAATGVDLDRLALLSGRGGAPAAVDDAGRWSPAPPVPTPRVEVVADGLHSAEVEITGATGPFWLVFGQSDS